jgi:hypothetical protein
MYFLSAKSWVLSGSQGIYSCWKAGSWGKSIWTYTYLRLGPNLPKTYTFTAWTLSWVLSRLEHILHLELGPILPCKTYTLSWALGKNDQGNISWNTDLAQHIYSYAETE